MKLRLHNLIPAAGLFMASVASADTFVLKNGERLDAKILKETADSYVLEVKVTKSIRDEKTIAKAEVAEIIPEKVDEVAFAPLKSLVPVPDFQSADEYSRRIALLAKFIKDNPKSPLVSGAEAMQTTLKTELSAISAGGIKFEGKVISAEDYAKDAYDFDARIIEKRTRDAAARGELLSALRGIDRLETDYKQTNSRRALTSLKTQVLQSYKAQIGELLATYDKRAEERRVGLTRMSGENRQAAESALAEELAQLKVSVKGDAEKQQRWNNIHPLDKNSLETTRALIGQAEDAEIQDSGKDAGKAYRNAYRIIGEETDPEKIKEVLDQAGEYEISEKYLDKLKDAAKAKGVQF